MALTGDPDGPPLWAKALQLEHLDAVARSFGESLRLLSNRAAIFGFTRNGTTTPGGATRLIQTADQYMAICLARPDDEAALPALVQADRRPNYDRWAFLKDHARELSAAQLTEQADLLGIAASTVGESGPVGFCVNGESLQPEAVSTGFDQAPVVLDLSGLWAGPLCAQLLQQQGATVIKVESSTRVDGARFGPSAFYDAMNSGKLSVALDFDHDVDRSALHTLIDRADIIITSSRKRAFDQLDIHPVTVMATAPNKVWAAISAHGWRNSRIGFGDDAGVAAGAVAWGADGRPRFLGDALADPVTGLMLAATVESLWNQGGQHFIDAPLSGAVRAIWNIDEAHTPALTAPACGEVIVADPQHQPAASAAAQLGADTVSVLQHFGVGANG